MPTHGSLSKAGKTRKSTPPVAKTNTKKKAFPRLKNKKKYHLREGLERKPGQQYREVSR